MDKTILAYDFGTGGTKDYVDFRMTGVMATDHSYASGSGVYGLKGWKYSDQLIAASGLAVEIFPEIVPSTEVLGTLLPEAVAELGLPDSVKVVAGGVDNSCMALEALAYKEGALLQLDGLLKLDRRFLRRAGAGCGNAALCLHPRGARHVRLGDRDFFRRLLLPLAEGNARPGFRL